MVRGMRRLAYGSDAVWSFAKNSASLWIRAVCIALGMRREMQNQLCCVVKPQLSENVFSVLSDREVADAEYPRGLLACMALSHKHGYIALTRR